MSQPTAPPAEAPAAEARDVVLSLCFVTWEDGHRRGMHFPPDRLIEALLAHPRTRRLLVVDPYRDRLRTYVKGALGRRLEPARTEDPARVRHLRPVRTRGVLDPAPVEDLERLYEDWDAPRGARGASGRDSSVPRSSPPIRSWPASPRCAGPPM